MTGKTEKIFEPPLITLKIENNEIFLSVFPQEFIFGLNKACLELLMNTGLDSESDELNEFKIECQNEDPSKTKVKLFVNKKHVGLKPFVQDMILGYNLGIINSLKGIPESIKSFSISFKKQDREIKDVEIK